MFIACAIASKSNVTTCNTNLSREVSMQRRFTVSLALAALIALSGCAGFKESLFERGLSYERWKSSLTEKTVAVGELNVSYLERQGTGDTIVLLHGFSANKDNWVRFVRYLPTSYRVIAIDLPGHGSTTRDGNVTYTIDYITQGFARTVDTLRLERFHLAGNSMGGYVSTLYSASHPDRVVSLCLLDASGIAKVPEKSDRDIAISKGQNPLVPKNMEEFRSTLEYAFHHRPSLPWPALDVMGARYLERSSFNGKLWKDISDHRIDTEGLLKDLHMPVLIMWGDKDRIVHVSAATVFQKGIPQAQTVIFKDCGHMPMVEIPKETARAYASFLERL
jgi:abhydrolase domain-containing protein 6